jgi:hypothetical protein
VVQQDNFVLSFFKPQTEMRCLWLATVLSLSGFLELASAIIDNTTSMSRPCCSCSWPYSIRIAVDDDQSDGLNTIIIYQPEDAWQQGRIGGCDSCPPPSITGLASMNTFHGSLFVRLSNLPEALSLRDNRTQKTKQASPKTSRLQLCFFSVSELLKKYNSVYQSSSKAAL